MAQTSYSGHVTVHPSEAVEVYGSTENGRFMKIYLLTADVEKLRAAFGFQDKHCSHLGHAFWHIENGNSEPCPQCRS